MIRTVGHLFRALASSFSSKDERPSSDRSNLQLSLPLAEPVVVGQLSKDDAGLYVFEYAAEFKASGLPPLPDFPRLDDTYKSPALWPFFAVRLPPVDRPDVKAQIERLHIDKEDTLQLLKSFGQRVISSPYELTPTT